MIIKLSPVRSDAGLSLVKAGDALIINGVSFDLARIKEGETLPSGAIHGEAIQGSVTRKDGHLLVTLMLPHSADAPEFVRFPADIVSPPDGVIALPGLDSEPSQPPIMAGLIDWSMLVTTEMEEQAAKDLVLTRASAEITSRRSAADYAIAPLQDAVDIEEATEAEAAALKAWKKYRVLLSRVPEQSGYPDAIDWPAPPA